MLEVYHAEIPSCGECRKWMYDQDWKLVKRLGQAVPRGNSPSPCWKCPKGPLPFVNEPTPTTLRTIDYYHACRIDRAGLLPRDRRVLDDQALIARLREHAMQQRQDLTPLLALLSTSSRDRKRKS